MTTSERLRAIIDDAAPKLEVALATNSLTSHLDTSLQLRYPQCGLASTALQAYLRDAHGIATERVAVRPRHAPKNMSLGVLTHVALRGDEMIDPTYSQFLNFIGLTPTVAAAHHLESLYPHKKIMVFQVANSERFADRFARHAHTIDQSDVIPLPIAEYPPDGALRGASLEAMQIAYRSIWTSEDYTPYTHPDPQTEQSLQEAAERVAGSMARL